MILEVIPVIPPGPPAAGAARRRPLRDLGPERPLPARHQPQQPAEAPDGAQRARHHHPQREAHAAGGRRRAVRQRPPRPRDHRSEQAPAQVALRHAEGQAAAASARTCSASASTTRVARSSSSAPSCACTSAACPRRWRSSCSSPSSTTSSKSAASSPPSRARRRWWRRRRPEVWDILDEVIREHPVLLNRAPDAAPPRHPGLRADPHRRQGDPAAPARLRRLQRRLRRRPDGRARAALGRGAGRSARAHDVDEQHPVARQRPADHRADARTSCSVSTT